ncbi:hypothetical protein P280DRAFT_517500 [Massarina eburnea CBS 473.64]|uniref:BTB domain-containing protein n=1 Tax=Massarina eburnea CBS 473.64 TaxID=1395130 RepID=A0A6A6S563_9PLEO|nr:hypothetical protein P280DRAFT_517500 [Massarina eburnea CBS 473.64]
MVDTTFDFGLGYNFGSSGINSLKRKRVEGHENGVQAASLIPDRRVTTAKALKLDCDILTVTVGVGEDKRSFKIHEDAICNRSEFFRNSMKAEWATMRPDPRVIELPEDDPEAFSLYRTWLYSGQLAILPDASSISTDSNSSSSNSSINDTTPEHYHTLAYAYVLGERLLDIPFKNAIVDAYVLYARGNPPGKRYYPSNEEIRIIYDGTGEGCPLRRLLVEIWYCRGKVDWIERDSDLPQDFLACVVKELLRVRVSVDQLSRPWKLSHTQYHEKEE